MIPVFNPGCWAPSWFPRTGALLSCALVAFCLSAVGQTMPAASNLADAPAKQFDLSPWGYPDFSPMDRFTTRFNATLHFLDNDHVLFTFNAKKLIRRHPECPPTHHDHITQAAVLELSSGKLVTENDWYLHDYGAYLWPLSSGHLLLRRLNSLYEIDSELHEKLLRDFSGPILWIGVTPDARQIMVETPLGNGEESGKKPEKAAAPERAKVKIDFLNVDTLAVEHSLQATGEMHPAATSFGYADFTHSPSRKLWLVRFGPSAQQRASVARIRSRCAPDLAFPTPNTLFIGRCSASSPAYSVSVFTLDGHPLWRQQWRQLNHFPQLVRNADGSRFAVGTITASSEAEPPTTSSEDDPGWPLVEEDFRVFETASGKLLLSVAAKDVILNNPTFSLSPDGRSFAMLDGTLLKLYSLAPEADEERAKYLALGANVPTLFAPVPSMGSSSEDAALDDADEPETPNRADADLSAAIGVTKPAPKPAAGGSEMAGNASPGSAPGESEPPVATIRAGTEEVLVDVVVTDGKGHPVKSLRKEDFQVQEDGKPQTLSSFREFDASAPEVSTVAAAPSTPAPNVFTNNSPVRSSLPRTLVMLDLVNTTVTDQQYAKQDLVKFLRKKPRDMQFAIFVMSTKLMMIQGFTADENALLASVSSKKTGIHFSSDMQPDASGLNEVIRETKINAQFNFATQFAVQQLQQLQYVDMAAQLDRRVALTVDAFTQLAGYLSALPGRKNLVWLSGSFPAAFIASDSLNADTPTAPSVIRKYDEAIRKATNSLAKSNIAVYPVDVRGLETDSVFESSNGVAATSVGPAGSLTPGPAGRTPGSPVAGTNTIMAIQAPSPLMQEMERANHSRAAEQGTMDQIAESTGGKAFYNSNAIPQAIETAVEQGSQYYLLSYSPQNRKYDGRFRKVKITLARNGYHLAYRHGYYADDPDAPLHNGAQVSRQVSASGMQHNAPEAHQLAFAVRVVPLGKPTKGRPSQSSGASATSAPEVEVQRYAIDYAVAGVQVHFEVKGETRRTLLDFMASAYAEDGSALAETALQTVNSLKPNVYRDVMIGGFRLHQELNIPTRAVSLRVGVVDETTAHLGTLELPLPLKVPTEVPQTRVRHLLPIEPD